MRVLASYDARSCVRSPLGDFTLALPLPAVTEGSPTHDGTMATSVLLTSALSASVRSFGAGARTSTGYLRGIASSSLTAGGSQKHNSAKPRSDQSLRQTQDGSFRCSRPTSPALSAPLSSSNAPPCRPPRSFVLLPGLALNICDVLGRGRAPGCSEAERRGPLPRIRYRAKLRERAGSRLFVWVFGL